MIMIQSLGHGMVKNTVGENSLGKSSRGVGRQLSSRALWAPQVFYSSRAARMASPPPSITTSSGTITRNCIVTTEDVTWTFLVPKPGAQGWPWLLFQQIQSMPASRRAVVTELEFHGTVAWIRHGGGVQHSHCVLLLVTELSVCSGFIFSLVPTRNKTPPTLPGVSNPTPPLQLLNTGCFERPFLSWGRFSSKI